MSGAASHQNVRLARGRHQRPEDGACVMELASMLAGEAFTDRPRAVCPALAALLRVCNDRFDDETRRQLYRYAAETVGTGGNPQVSEARVTRCAEAVRGRARGNWLTRRLNRPLEPPSEPLGPGLDGFAADVVRSFGKDEQGTRELLVLVDELIAMQPAVAGVADPRAERAGAASELTV